MENSNSQLPFNDVRREIQRECHASEVGECNQQRARHVSDRFATPPGGECQLRSNCTNNTPLN